jgi:hypothetical protein
MGCWDRKIYTSAGTLCFNGRDFDRLERDYPDQKLYRIPDAMVYPLTEHKRLELDAAIDRSWKQDLRGMFGDPCIGYHWYGGSHYSAPRQYQLTHDKTTREKNTITQILKGLDL